METRKEICLCAVCREMLYEGENLAEHFKYEFDGELDYIELAHVHCATTYNAQHNTDYWVYGSHYADDPRDEDEGGDTDDAWALASAGRGTDEDYGDFGHEFD